jgi:hypothetical protein
MMLQPSSYKFSKFELNLVQKILRQCKFQLQKGGNMDDNPNCSATLAKYSLKYLAYSTYSMPIVVP